MEKYLLTVTIILLTSLLFGVANVIRGSGKDTNLPTWFNNKIFFAVICGAAVGVLVNSLTVAVIVAVGLRIGVSLGWGEYVSALQDGRPPVDPEVYVIDCVVEPLKDNPRMWGFWALTIRGWLVGLTCAIPLLFVYKSVSLIAGLQLGGASMGVAFWLASKVNVQNQWRLGEFIWGVLFGAFVALMSLTL